MVRDRKGIVHLNLAPTRRAKRTLRPRTTSSLLKYGLSVSDYNKMVVAQGGMCAICGKRPVTINLAVDHDHTLLKKYGVWVINGLLCRRCNSGLGRFEWSDEVLTRLVSYAKMILRRRAKYAKEEGG